jgi:hypothetical protein
MWRKRSASIDQKTSEPAIASSSSGGLQRRRIVQLGGIPQPGEFALMRPLHSFEIERNALAFRFRTLIHGNHRSPLFWG